MTRMTTRLRRRRLLRPLDRYVATEFLRIFTVTSVGFPILVFVFDLVDNLRKYTDRNIPAADIALSYWFFIPDTMYKVLPAAVLFASVFTVSNLTRYSELTAAKASGMSFHRIVFPVFVVAGLSSILGLVIGELSPPANTRRLQLLRESCRARTAPSSGQAVCNENTNSRYNFVFGGEDGRVVRASFLNVGEGTMQGIETEQRGDSLRPTQLAAAETAGWNGRSAWVLRDGHLHIIPDAERNLVIGFDSLVDRSLTQTPVELRASDKTPEEMRYGQLSGFITTLERAGADVRGLRVERMLRIAVPVTCLLIAMFGAPLATSTQRGGTAFGIGISLGATVVILLLIQLTKAIGKSGVVSPEIAAWVPNILVLSTAVVLLRRVRT
jgi:lipopolysaccharide export system permease protein